MLDIHQLEGVKDVEVVAPMKGFAPKIEQGLQDIASKEKTLIRGIVGDAPFKGAIDNLSMIHAAVAFDMGKIEARFVRDQGKDESIAHNLAVELKKFLALSALNPTRRYEMAGPVDDMWHVFLLFTMEYRSFCQLFGKNVYVDHVPADRVSFISHDSGYVRFLEDYKEVFGPPSVAFWPQVNHVGFRVISSGAEIVVPG